MTKKVEGYAVVRKGEIDIKTVGGTRREAIINWLVGNFHVMILTSTTDQRIEELWEEHGKGTTVIPVEVRQSK